MKNTNLLFILELCFLASCISNAQDQNKYSPTVQTKHIAIYDLNSQHLMANEQILIQLPTHFQKGNLDFISIAHRQLPHEENECPVVNNQDCLPAYTSVEVYNEDTRPELNGWRYWGGKGSGPVNSKFAEIRAHNPETDNLYEWQHKGHWGFNKVHSREPIFPSAIRIRNLGPDSSYIHKLIVKLLPERPESIDEYIFSQEFRFGDYANAAGQLFPRGAGSGNYGQAFAIGHTGRSDHSRIPHSWQVKKGKFIIPLNTDANKSISFVDIAVGDMRPVRNGQAPENYRGNANLSIFHQQNGQNIETLMSRENIGTSGILRAHVEKNILNPQSELVFVVEKGTAQIMGIRIGYRKSDGVKK